MSHTNAPQALRSVGAGLFWVFIALWTLAMVMAYPAYTAVALTAAGVTFVLSARHQARAVGRRNAAAIAARADQDGPWRDAPQ